MHTLVIYDIPDDRLRTRVSDTCRKYGLSMIQKSAYMGRIHSGTRKELLASLRRTMRGKEGNIQVFVLEDQQARGKVVIGDPDYLKRQEGLERFLV